MKHVCLGILLWFTLFLPGSARGAEEAYQLLAFEAGLKQAMKDDGHWEACGEYFAAVETTEGKVVHFHFERVPPGIAPRVFVFLRVGHVNVSISESAAAPLVVVKSGYGGTWFLLRMKVADYKVALPCLGTGDKT